MLARYGGEEFVLLLPESEPRQAARTAERLRGVIAGRPFLVSEPDSSAARLTVTASLGVASRTAATATDETLLAAADGALYRAKRVGGNCVMWAAPPDPAAALAPLLHTER